MPVTLESCTSSKKLRAGDVVTRKKLEKMNHINVSMTVRGTAKQTMDGLREFFTANAPQAELTIALRAPFDVAVLHVGLTLTRDVTARVVPLGVDDRAYSIAWQPVDPGPFPAFNGTIFVDAADSNPDESVVTLDGHYHPPLGVAGNVFDAFVGKHIAQASAADFLDRICAFVETNAEPEPQPA